MDTGLSMIMRSDSGILSTFFIFCYIHMYLGHVSFEGRMHACGSLTFC